MAHLVAEIDVGAATALQVQPLAALAGVCLAQDSLVLEDAVLRVSARFLPTGLRTLEPLVPGRLCGRGPRGRQRGQHPCRKDHP